MYAIGRRVYCKPLDRVGEIIEANYVGKPKVNRHAQYLVEFRDHLNRFVSDYLCGKESLVPADFCCDGCNKWRKGSPYRQVFYMDELQLEYCFMCVEVYGPQEEAKERLNEASY